MFDIYLSKNAKISDHAKLLAQRAAIGAVVGSANSMRKKYEGNRGEGFVSGLGGTVAGLYGKDYGAQAGMETGAPVGAFIGRRIGSIKSPNEAHRDIAELRGAGVGLTAGRLAGGAAGGIVAGNAGAYASRALYNKLRGKKKEEENKDV